MLKELIVQLTINPGQKPEVQMKQDCFLHDLSPQFLLVLLVCLS